MISLLVSILAISIGIFIYTVLGFGASLFAMPLLLLVMPLPEAVGLLSLFLFAFSFFMILKNRKDNNRVLFLKLSAGSIIGLFVGMRILVVNGHFTLFKKIFGVYVLVYVVYALSHRKGKLPHGMSPIFGFIGGLLQGIYTNGGPMYVTYLQNKLTDKTVLRATIIAALGINNLIRLPSLAIQGLVTRAILMNALIILPFFLLAIYFGHKAYHAINEQLFHKTVLIVLFSSGLLLIFT